MILDNVFFTLECPPFAHASAYISITGFKLEFLPKASSLVFDEVMFPTKLGVRGKI